MTPTSDSVVSELDPIASTSGFVLPRMGNHPRMRTDATTFGSTRISGMGDVLPSEIFAILPGGFATVGISIPTAARLPPGAATAMTATGGTGHLENAQPFFLGWRRKKIDVPSGMLIARPRTWPRFLYASNVN